LKIVFCISLSKRGPDYEIPTGSLSIGTPNRGGVPKICFFQQYFRNTDSAYRGISKYRNRIPNRHEKSTDENTDTDPALISTIPVSLSPFPSPSLPFLPLHTIPLPSPSFHFLSLPSTARGLGALVSSPS